MQTWFVTSGLPLNNFLLLVLVFATFLRGRAQFPNISPGLGAILVWLCCCVAALAALSVLSVLHAEDVFRVGRPILVYAQFFVLIWVVLWISEADNSFDVTTVLIISGYIAAAFVVLDLIVPMTKEPGDEYDRTSGWFKNPNQLGIALSMLLPSAAVATIYSSKGKLFHFLGALLLFLALAASGSKTNFVLGIMGVVAVFLIAPWTHNRWRFAALHSVRNLALMGVSLIPVWWVINWLNPRTVHVLANYFLNSVESATITGRKAMWAYGLEAGFSNPMMGVGAGQYTLQPLTGEYLSHSHNVVVDYIRTSGVPGAVLICALLLGIAALIIRALFYSVNSDADRFDRLQAVGLSVGAACFIASNQMSDSIGPTTAPLFWILLGCLFISANRMEKASSSTIRSERVAWQS